MILIHLPVFVEKKPYKIQNSVFFWWCLLCIRYGIYKMKGEFVRTCALRRKPNSPFLTERLLVSSRLHENVFSSNCDIIFICKTLSFRCRRLLGFFSQSANGIIIHTVSKRISQVNVVYHCGSSDQMAPPFGNPPPLKRWTKLFTLLSFALTFSYCPII